jgi:imidazolonepropionase-like amidohydrolase
MRELTMHAAANQPTLQPSSAHSSRVVPLAALALALGVGCSPAWAAEPVDLKPLDDSATLFRGFTVLTMADPTGGVLREHSVLVRDGRIAELGPADAVNAPEGARVIEGQGRFLAPGLADMHVHFPPFTGEQGDAAWRMCTLMVANGVTTARGMQGHPAHIQLRRRLVDGTLLGPTAHVAGPAVTFQSAPSPEVAAENIALQHEVGYDFIKSHRVVDPDVHAAVIAAAKKAGLPVAGHVDNEVGLERVLPTGQQIEHLDGFFAALLTDPKLANQFGQVVPAGHPEVFDLSRIPAVAKQIADAKAWSGPTMALFRNLASAHEPIEAWAERPELKYIARPAREAWLTQRKGLAQPGLFGSVEHAKWFIDNRAAMLRAIRDAGGRLLLSSDAPQAFLVAGFAAHDEMQAMVDAGLSPAEVLFAATRAPADYFAELPNRGSTLGITPDFGTIAPGRRADLLVLREDPLRDIRATRAIDAVVLRGRVLDRAELDTLLAKVEESARAAG